MHDEAPKEALYCRCGPNPGNNVKEEIRNIDIFVTWKRINFIFFCDFLPETEKYTPVTKKPMKTPLWEYNPEM